MTDRGAEEPLTPEEEAAVSALLADAAGPVAMPADVAARLDDVLADLEKERADGAEAAEPPGQVVELSRRRWPRLVLAAAAVVVGGYSVGSVVIEGGLSGGADTATSDTAADGGGAMERSRTRGPRDEGAEFGADQDGGRSESPQSGAGDAGRLETALVTGRPVGLAPDRLDPGVRRALEVLERQRPARTGSSDTRSEGRTCPAPELGEGERALRVRYDGEPAVLVAAAPEDGLVEVTIHGCDGTELDSTVVER